MMLERLSSQNHASNEDVFSWQLVFELLKQLKGFIQFLFDELFCIYHNI
jgi:hypothetical protein